MALTTPLQNPESRSISIRILSGFLSKYAIIQVEQPLVLLLYGHLGVIERNGIVGLAERTLLTGFVNVITMHHIGKHLLVRYLQTFFDQLGEATLGASLGRCVDKHASSRHRGTLSCLCHGRP